jgi:threonine/homoserine/homoserine lactone efflux protein
MMLDAITDILPMAAGIAMSPIPIAAVVSILLAADARKASAFLLGWAAGILAIGLLVLFIPGLRMLNGDPTPLAGWLRILLGGALLAVAWRKWQQRPAPEAQVEQPRFLTKIDSYNGRKALMLGITLSMFNPKSLVFASASAMTIYEAQIAGQEKAAVLIAFTVISSLSVGVPIVFTWARRDKAQKILEDLKDWLIANNTAVTIALLVVFALLIVGSGLKIVFNG